MPVVGVNLRHPVGLGLGGAVSRMAEHGEQAVAGDQVAALVAIFPAAGSGPVEGQPQVRFEMQPLAFMLSLEHGAFQTFQG